MYVLYDFVCVVDVVVVVSAVCYAKHFGPKGFGLGNAAMIEERPV